MLIRVHPWMTVALLVFGASSSIRAQSSSSSSSSSATSRILGLEEVLAHADAHAPEIAIARGRVEIARADVVAANPWLPADPVVDAMGGGRSGGGQDGADLGLGLSQSFEIFGERGLRHDAASRVVDAADADVAVARFRVHQAVHKAFHAALVADAEVDTAEDAVVFADRVTALAEARVKAGDASSLTTRLARTSAQRAREQALLAEANQQVARLALGREAGFGDGIAIAPAGTMDTPSTLPPTSTLRALAEQHQPTLHALMARVQAADAARALAGREALPKPVVGVSYAVEGLAPSTWQAQQTQQIVQATVAVPLPLFRGNDAARARSTGEHAVAVAELEGQRRLLATRIEEAWARSDAARRRVVLFVDQILPGLDETSAQLELAFRLGEIEVTEVLVGREQVLAARRDALAAWRSWYDARADLEIELGTELPSSSSSSSPSSSTSTTTAP